MKEDLCEYYPNGNKKHVIRYYPNGQKRSEQFYDQLGKFHQESGIPDYQSCYVTGITDLITFYAHGGKKYKMSFYPNGNKWHEQYYDRRGYGHRASGLPDYHCWYENNISHFKTYYVHGDEHNIHNPSFIRFINNGKIRVKSYYLNDQKYSKLNWQNQIKNI